MGLEPTTFRRDAPLCCETAWRFEAAGLRLSNILLIDYSIQYSIHSWSNRIKHTPAELKPALRQNLAKRPLPPSTDLHWVHGL